MTTFGKAFRHPVKLPFCALNTGASCARSDSPWKKAKALLDSAQALFAGGVEWQLTCTLFRCIKQTGKVVGVIE
jgi:hypothetical protein